MSEHIYKIEHKIQTLAKNAISDKTQKSYDIFSVENIIYKQWNFNFKNGWSGNAWIAKSEIPGKNFLQAINIFRNKMRKVIPRIALISQSYIEYLLEPFVVHKKGSDVAYFHCTKDTKVGGLMFINKERNALEELLKLENISDEFYYYWNDAVNTFGYSGKLLLMFSALEALARKRDKRIFKSAMDLYIDILGEDLAKKIFNKTTGLRNRLSHGEYFTSEQDSKNNYFELIHKKIICFFNNKILSKPLLSEKVINPHRHFWGNKSEWRSFVKRTDNSKIFNLKDLMHEVSDDKVGFRNNKKYKLVDVRLCSKIQENY